MPEYFSISLLSEKETYNTPIKELFQNQFGLYLDKNLLDNSSWVIFNNREIIINKYEFGYCDFAEYMISFPEQFFYKSTFEKDIQPFINFMNICLESNDYFKIGLGSYELNGYLLKEIKTLKEITDDFLLKFPVVFIKSDPIKLILNENAQDIFVVE